MAEKLKAAKQQTAIAKLNDVPTSPRKMRLIADIIRGVEVNRALDILKFSKKHASIDMEKVLRSAVANWEAKNQDNVKELDNGNVYVKTVMVDEGRTLKRIRHAHRAAPDVSASVLTTLLLSSMLNHQQLRRHNHGTEN